MKRKVNPQALAFNSSAKPKNLVCKSSFGIYILSIHTPADPYTLVTQFYYFTLHRTFHNITYDTMIPRTTCLSLFHHLKTMTLKPKPNPHHIWHMRISMGLVNSNVFSRATSLPLSPQTELCNQKISLKPYTCPYGHRFPLQTFPQIRCVLQENSARALDSRNEFVPANN